MAPEQGMEPQLEQGYLVEEHMAAEQWTVDTPTLDELKEDSCLEM